MQCDNCFMMTLHNDDVDDAYNVDDDDDDENGDDGNGYDDIDDDDVNGDYGNGFDDIDDIDDDDNDKKKKNDDICADHHCLSLFVLPHPGLLSRQTDETQVSKFQQQQLPQQQASATSGSNSNSIISNNAVVSSNIIIISTNLRPAVGIDRVEGEESTRLLDFALASTFSYCRCWHAGTI